MLAEIRNLFAPFHWSGEKNVQYSSSKNTDEKIQEGSVSYLTKLISVNITVPESVLPNLFPAEVEAFVEGGKTQPSILAKSRKPSRWNSNDAPSRIFEITSIENLGGVW